MLINGVNYIPVDTKEKITIADSFVVRANKIGSGNGEAKLYVGNENAATRKFFGKKGFINNCFLLKQDLLKYLDETKEEYLSPNNLINLLLLYLNYGPLAKYKYLNYLILFGLISRNKLKLKGLEYM
ncbi:hypothetical protein [Actinobacillus equuli]|uniref:hypothetical protein n=1 Tax=Actinobacillus equuli TaxID=718 RepID=UPI00244340D6|nr:hypothetical protein [Actinobacillus equuli]WGE61666.1 hypothetical protein NYR74_02650 [Actinobacillus equuli subsp. haemolyticus]